MTMCPERWATTCWDSEGERIVALCCSTSIPTIFWTEEPRRQRDLDSTMWDIEVKLRRPICDCDPLSREVRFVLSAQCTLVGPPSKPGDPNPGPLALPVDVPDQAQWREEAIAPQRPIQEGRAHELGIVARDSGDGIWWTRRPEEPRGKPPGGKLAVSDQGRQPHLAGRQAVARL